MFIADKLVGVNAQLSLKLFPCVIGNIHFTVLQLATKDLDFSAGLDQIRFLRIGSELLFIKNLPEIFKMLLGLLAGMGKDYNIVRITAVKRDAPLEMLIQLHKIHIHEMIGKRHSGHSSGFTGDDPAVFFYAFAAQKKEFQKLIEGRVVFPYLLKSGQDQLRNDRRF